MEERKLGEALRGIGTDGGWPPYNAISSDVPRIYESSFSVGQSVGVPHTLRRAVCLASSFFFCVMRDSNGSSEENRAVYALTHLCGDTRPLASSSMSVQHTLWKNNMTLEQSNR